MEERKSNLTALVAAEVLGTFMLVLFGLGSVHAAVLSGAQVGLWQVAIVWGSSIMLACFVVGGVSGAHLNPAVTLGLAAWGKFPARLAIPYIAGQLAGAFIAAAVLFGLWNVIIENKERQLGAERGSPNSVFTAMCYGEYFPNPGAIDSFAPPASASIGAAASNRFEGYLKFVPHGVAFGAEVIGTLILALVICATTDDRNRGAPAAKFAPVFIGLTVAALVSIVAPLTQACFNPARDWGPRIFAYFAGWGEVAIPGPNGIGSVTVYILAPIVGAVLGVGLYERGVRSWLASTS